MRLVGNDEFVKSAVAAPRQGRANALARSDGRATRRFGTKRFDLESSAAKGCERAYRDARSATPATLAVRRGKGPGRRGVLSRGERCFCRYHFDRLTAVEKRGQARSPRREFPAFAATFREPVPIFNQPLKPPGLRRPSRAACRRRTPRTRVPRPGRRAPRRPALQNPPATCPARWPPPRWSGRRAFG